MQKGWFIIGTSMALKNYKLPFFRAAEPGRVGVHTVINIAQKIDQFTIAQSSSSKIHCLPDVCILYGQVDCIRIARDKKKKQKKQRTDRTEDALS